MKKFLVIGNPIEHSLSPKLHNYWIKNNNINAVYEKQKLSESSLKNIISQIKEKKIYTKTHQRSIFRNTKTHQKISSA